MRRRGGAACRADRLRGTARDHAAAEGHLAVVTLLLDRGASVDLAVPGDENALIQASGNGHLEVVKLLVSRGANVNARIWADANRADGEWRTPLGMARKGRHGAVVEFLQSAGAPSSEMVIRAPLAAFRLKPEATPAQNSASTPSERHQLKRVASGFSRKAAAAVGPESRSH